MMISMYALQQSKLKISTLSELMWEVGLFYFTTVCCMASQ